MVTMRVRPSITLFACLLFLTLLGAKAQDSPDAATIRGLEDKWADAYRARRFDVLSSLIADDYVITFEDGSVYSKVGLISESAQPNKHVDLSEFADLKIRLHGDIAVVTGSYHERGETGAKHYDYTDRFTDVWMRSQGKWQLIASHYSVPAR
jgi:ketosteroid isomerase-like protein